MEYEISEGFIDIIGKIKRWWTAKFLIAFFGFLISTYALCHKLSGNNLMSNFLLCILIILCPIILLSYLFITRPGLMINKMASTVLISDDEITIETIPFKVLFCVNKPSQKLNFKISEIKIEKDYNPLMPFVSRAFRMDDKTFIISDKEKKSYIIIDFFNKELKDKLIEISIKDVPEYLLIPGRLRHR